MVTINNLRCDYLERPMGVEALAPRLSWCLQCERSGTHQSAYQILVASSIDSLKHDPDLWDSGRVESDASVLVPYTGKRLRSRQQCFWQVRIRDDQGEEHLSEPSVWEMGLLRPEDWKAKWMAGNTPKRYHDVPASPIFRKEFRLKSGIVKARAYVCGLGFHEFHLNGRKVGDAVLHPAHTKYDTRALYSVHDITEYLVSGNNAAGIMTGTGWYDHHPDAGWNRNKAPWRDECKAIVQIEVTLDSGKIKRIVSDHSWFYSPGPVLFDGLHMGEVYDAREEKEGWCGPGYDASDWKPVRIARPPGGILRAQLMPPIRVTNTLRPAKVHEIRPGVHVFDMGKNIAGWTRLKVQDEAGRKIILKHAEKLGPDGDIDTSNIVHRIDPGLFQTDTFILKGSGTEVVEPHFSYHGFQYVQASGLPGKASLDMVEGCEIHTDLKRTGSFDCSNPLLNQIHEAAIASTLGNYHGMPTDCPHREKNGWTGDAHLSAEQVLFNFDAASAYTKWMDDFSDCQRPNGALPGIVPTAGWGYNWGAGPAWDSAYILIPWYLYLYTGDVGILRAHYEGMKRYLGFLGSIATDNIVHFGLGDWCPPTGNQQDHKAPRELTNTAYYHMDAVIVGRIAKVLGKQSEAKRFQQLAKRIKASARKGFWNAQAGWLAGHSQTSIACFLYQGLAEPEETDLFKKMLFQEVEACNFHIDCGILGTKYVLNTLTELSCAEAAYRIVGQRDYPSWGHWIEQGATTLWERWDGSDSRNHHMFSDVSAWMYKTLAGIMPDPELPGFKHAIIKPWIVEDLTHASGEIQTPYGLLRSSWRKTEDCISLRVRIPANSHATIHVPALRGFAVWDFKEKVHCSEPNSKCGPRPGQRVFHAESGDYLFTSKITT